MVRSCARLRDRTSGRKKLAKELARDRERIRSLQQAIVFDKALDFLVSKATLTTAAPKV